ncbi:MAG: glycosyltransferase family 10 [Alphaproteobacteria bacterium]|nr:glycosyltransferase family 10 [Alphaproteobacteria bacterium]
MEYKHVDCPGRVLHNIDIPELETHKGNWGESKRELLKKYKFTIAFENSSSNGYTTEKLFDPFFATSVPIYFGNPIVAKDFNSKAFINANDFNNDFDAIIEGIKFLDTHRHEYLKMLRESPVSKNYDFDIPDKFEAWLISIIEKGNKPFNKDPLAFSPRIYNKEWRTLRHQKRAIVALYCVVALLMVCMVLLVLH